MAVRGYRVRRRELWRARLYGWPERLRRFEVWGLALIGLAILAGTGWWYADHSAFARRAVPTTAIIEQFYPPGRIESQYDPPALVLDGMLRYQVNGHTIHARVRLATCSTSVCVAATHSRKGRPVQIAYDPTKVSRVYLGRTIPSPITPITMLFMGIGVVFVAAALYTLFFDLGVPVTNSRDR